MRLKQTARIITLAAVFALGGLLFAGPAVAAECGSVQTSIINCEQDGGSTPQETGVWGILLLVINILTAGVGVVAVGGIVYASILYISAGGSGEQTKKALGIIANVVIGVLAYALMYAVLNFLVPGGLFAI